VVRFVVSDLPVDRDFDADCWIVLRLLDVDAFEDRGFAFGTVDAGSVVHDPVCLRLGAHVVQREGMSGVVRGHVSRDSAGAGGDDVRGARGAALAGSGESERAALSEATTDREDDTEGHGRGEHSSHAGHDGFDSILRPGGCNDKPEDHVRQIDEENGPIQIETIAEHQLPRAEGLGLKRIDRAHQGKTERNGIKQCRSYPVDTDPVVFRTCDTALALKEWYRPVEAARYGSDNYLNSEEGSHSQQDSSIFVVDGMDPDNVDSRGSSKENRSANGLKKIELLARCL